MNITKLAPLLLTLAVAGCGQTVSPAEKPPVMMQIDAPPTYTRYAQEDKRLLLHFADVQRELGITSAQKAALQDALTPRAMPEADHTFRWPWQKPPKPDVQPSIGDVLTSAQEQRLQQLALQWHGPVGLADPANAAVVGVSEASQRKIVAALLNKYGYLRQTPHNSKVALGLLTPQEQAQWRIAQGTPFRFAHDPYDERLQYSLPRFE